MRTTLDIDPDILGVAKELAAQQGTSAGKVLSDLARKALTPSKACRVIKGFEPIQRKPDSPIITMEFVNELRDED